LFSTQNRLPAASIKAIIGLSPVPIEFAGAAVDVTGVEYFAIRTGLVDITAFFALQHQLFRGDGNRIGKEG
jgi:hypothetical protein